MSNNRWTVMIKSMRLISNRSLKVAAKELGISATYLFDVEAGNRPPTEKLIGSIIELYDLDDEAKRLLFDAAAEANNSLPQDIVDFLKNNSDAIKAVRNMMDDKNRQK